MHFGGTTARALRAALFALVCVGTGAELHHLANGSDPSWVGPLLALPIMWLAAYGLASRERSPLVLTAVLGVAQLGLHVELGWFCPKLMPGMPGYGMGADHGMAAMVLAHVGAVVIAGWWLGRGERGFFDLCRAIGVLVAPRLLVRVGAVLPSPLWRGIHVTARRTTVPSGGPAPSPRVLRGPPSFSLSRTCRRFPLITS